MVRVFWRKTRTYQTCNPVPGRGCRFGMSALIWQTRVFRDPEVSGRDLEDSAGFGDSVVLDFFFRNACF